MQIIFRQDSLKGIHILAEHQLTQELMVFDTAADYLGRIHVVLQRDTELDRATIAVAACIHDGLQRQLAVAHKTALSRRPPIPHLKVEGGFCPALLCLCGVLQVGQDGLPRWKLYSVQCVCAKCDIWLRVNLIGVKRLIITWTRQWQPAPRRESCSDS